MKHLSVSKIISASTDECLSMLSEIHREMAKRLGNDPRAVLLRLARGGPGDSPIDLPSGDHDPAKGPWSRAEFDAISRSLGNDPVIVAARFEARGGTFTDDEGEDDSDDGDSDDGDDDGPAPLAAISDDGARRRTVRRMRATGARLHSGQAAPLWPREYVPASVDDPAPVVGRVRRS